MNEHPAHDGASTAATDADVPGGGGGGATHAHGASPMASPVVRRGALLGAMFLMATSAIGPGFITQTTVFTAQIGAAFAFAILVSVLVDVAVQLNVWRVIGVSGLRAQDLANRVIPGGGYVLSALVVFGGLVFNIGNIGGTALGANAMMGADVKIGGAVSALIAIAMFLSRRAGIAMDRIVVVLGLVMIGMIAYVAVASGPPVGEALKQTVLPDDIDFLIITTLIGGTVGGYITYAGAHRLVDSGITGPGAGPADQPRLRDRRDRHRRDARPALPRRARRRGRRSRARHRQPARLRLPARPGLTSACTCSA